MISPSPGMISPADDDARRRRRRAADDGTVARCAPSAPRAGWRSVSVRALRSVSAWALPRPSAIASAKLANSTVNHSHAATRPAKTFSSPSTTRGRAANRIVVRTLPISTTNMTGLRAIRRGSSLPTLSHGRPPDDRRGRTATDAGDRSRASVRAAARTGAVSCTVVLIRRLELLDDRARARGRGSRSGRRRSGRRRRAGRRTAGVPVGKVPADGGHRLLAGQRAGDGQHRARSGGTGRPASTRPSVVLYQSVLPVRPPKAEPLLLPAEVKA